MSGDVPVGDASESTQRTPDDVAPAYQKPRLLRFGDRKSQGSGKTVAR